VSSLVSSFETYSCALSSTILHQLYLTWHCNNLMFLYNCWTKISLLCFI